MSVLVVAIEKPYWQDVMIQLAGKALPISAAIVHYRDAGGPNQFFENFKGKLIRGRKFYRIEDLSKELIRDFGSDWPLLDEKIINALQSAERDFYILTDRFSYFPKSFRYRKRLFRESLRYWLAFFTYNKISAVFHGCTPHNLADYTAFHVAKYLNIPTVLVAHTMINDYVLIRYDYRENIKVPDDFMANADEEEIKTSIPVELYKAAMNESRILQKVIEKNDASAGLKNLNISSGEKRIDIKRALERLKRSLWRAPRFTGGLGMNGTFPPIVRRLLKLRDLIYQRTQQKLHDRLAIKPDLSEKYIYFAMHLQPERTSTPEAEVFEDHLLAIDILSHSLPPGWKLYVKENPRQFKKINFLKGRQQRDVSDYEDFLHNPNVQLISQEIPSKTLIKNAEAVSTLSGSLGWEALRSGKPCIIFANAWYSACQSAYRVSNIAEARAAISKCQSTTPQKVKDDILRYLAYMQNVLVIGNMGHANYLRASTMSYDILVNKMAEAIYREFARILKLKELQPAA